MGQPEGSTLNIWYRDGVNPDVDVVALGYIPPELGEAIDEFGRPFTKICGEDGDKYDLPLYIQCSHAGTVALVFEVESLSSKNTDPNSRKKYMNYLIHLPLK